MTALVSNSTAPQYTDEQRAALATRDVAVSLDAGAGCGKTFVLTERFLSHLDPAGPYGESTTLDRVVAITFTDAAAREMRDRVRRRCRERLAEAPPEHRDAWDRLLRSLDRARVSTIHGFASRLVRASAIELGIDPEFGVMDAAEAQTLRSAAAEETLGRRMTQPGGEPDPDLTAAAARLGVGPMRSQVQTLADFASHEAFGRWLKASPEDVVDAWLRYYRDRVAPTQAETLLGLPAAAELAELLDIATPVTPGFAERIEAIRDALGHLRAGDEVPSALTTLGPLLRLTRDDGKHVSKAADWPDADSKRAYSAAAQALRKELDKQRRLGDAASMRGAAELGLRLGRLAAETADAYRLAKRRRGVLDQDDLLFEANRLLTHPDYAEARRKAADGIDVLLVDEFQDTDRVQAGIVRALVGELDRSEGPGRLFFVGDFKQSIYRFRGAEPAVFRELQAETPERGRLTLSRNFRSQPGVLRFVNGLFGPVFGEAYTPLAAHRATVAERPAVGTLWTPPPETDDGRTPSVADCRRAEARAIATLIRGWIDAGEPIVGERHGDAESARAVRPGDVALLFRAMSDAAIYEEALREAGLDYYLVGGQAFYAQQEVLDLLNLLLAVTSECDDVALLGVLRSPLFGLPDEALYWLGRRDGLNAGLANPAVTADAPEAMRRLIDHARAVLGTLRREKDRLSAGDLLRRAFDLTGYDAAVVAEFLGERKLANVEKVHEQARQADASGAGVLGLVSRLREFVSRPPKEPLAAMASEDSGVVRLMSIHRAKGLEFPVVVLPDLDRKQAGDRTSAAFDPELGPLAGNPSDADTPSRDRPATGLDFYRATQGAAEREELDRLFYVACTRAADRLVLSSCLDPTLPPTGRWLQRLAERYDLVSGRGLAGDAPDMAVWSPADQRRPAPTKRPSRQALVDAIDTAVDLPIVPQPARVKPLPADPLPEAATGEAVLSVSRLDGCLAQDATPEGADDTRRSTRRWSAVEDGVDPRRFGTLVHAVLERLPLEPEPDEAIARWTDVMATPTLRRSVDVGASRCRDILQRFTRSGTWRRVCQAERVIREAPFCLRWPPAAAANESDSTPDEAPAALRGTIDAVVRDDQSWWVLDYKTNRVAAAAVPAEAETYRFQLAVYALAIEATLGERPRRLSLAFVELGVEHELPWEDGDRLAAIEELNAALAAARTRTSRVEEPTRG